MKHSWNPVDHQTLQLNAVSDPDFIHGPWSNEGREEKEFKGLPASAPTLLPFTYNKWVRDLHFLISEVADTCAVSCIDSADLS